MLRPSISNWVKSDPTVKNSTPVPTLPAIPQEWLDKHTLGGKLLQNTHPGKLYISTPTSYKSWRKRRTSEMFTNRLLNVSCVQNRLLTRLSAPEKLWKNTASNSLSRMLLLFLAKGYRYRLKPGALKSYDSWFGGARPTHARTPAQKDITAFYTCTTLESAL